MKILLILLTPIFLISCGDNKQEVSNAELIQYLENMRETETAANHERMEEMDRELIEAKEKLKQAREQLENEKNLK